jgi:hypothetical protein
MNITKELELRDFLEVKLKPSLDRLRLSQYIKIECSAVVFVIFYKDDMKTPFDVTHWKSVDDFLNGKTSFWKKCECLYNTLNDNNIRYKWMPFVKTASNCSSLSELEMKMQLMGY